MFHCLDHTNCDKFIKQANPSDKIKCMWPLNHADKNSLHTKATIRNLPILDKHGIQAAGLNILTRSQAGENFVNARENINCIIEKTDKRLQSLVEELASGL